MLDQLIKKLKEQTSGWDEYQHMFREIVVPPKTILMKENEISQNIYFVKEGCLRLWFSNDGKDITFQFFFENQGVSGLMGRGPSIFTLESIEPCKIVILRIDDFEAILYKIPELKDMFMEVLMQRLESYSRLFLSRIKDSPQKRYEKLVDESPQILKRIPQYYIASYLGIAPVSLSRIRNRK
jgi:CRP-like cAMP-binding protein